VWIPITARPAPSPAGVPGLQRWLTGLDDRAPLTVALRVTRAVPTILPVALSRIVTRLLNHL
jgi:hypothetical protein